jgi:hypothetical protein
MGQELLLYTEYGEVVLNDIWTTPGFLLAASTEGLRSAGTWPLPPDGGSMADRMSAPWTHARLVIGLVRRKLGGPLAGH